AVGGRTEENRPYQDPLTPLRSVRGSTPGTGLTEGTRLPSRRPTPTRSPTWENSASSLAWTPTNWRRPVARNWAFPTGLLPPWAGPPWKPLGRGTTSTARASG